MRITINNLSLALAVCASFGLFFGCAAAGSKALKSNSVGIPFASIGHEDESMRGQYADPNYHLPSPPSNEFYEAEFAPMNNGYNGNLNNGYNGGHNNGYNGGYNGGYSGNPSGGYEDNGFDVPWANTEERKPSPEDRQVNMKQHWDEFRAGRRTEDIPAHLRPLPPLRGPFESRDPVGVSEVETYLLAGAAEPYAERPDAGIEFDDWELEDPRFDWSSADPGRLFVQVRDMMGMGPDETEANQMMNEGRSILETNKDLKDIEKNRLAAKKFEKAAKKWPDSILEEDALYLAAECRYFSDEYPKAMWLYQALIHKYHSTRYMNTATRRLFSIGRYWDKLDRKGASTVNFSDKSRPRLSTFSSMQKSYEAIFINDPNGPLADDAVMALAEAYMAKGKNSGDSHFEKASFYYAYLRENFHDSPHVAKAYEQELIARHNAYLGSEYDAKTLDTAEKLADQTLLQYRSDPNVNMGAIREVSSEIANQKAKREWVFGQYYDNKKEYRAARVYYNRITKDHSNSEFAVLAQKRLQEISKLPDEPYGFEQWANDVFPSRTKKR